MSEPFGAFSVNFSRLWRKGNRPHILDDRRDAIDASLLLRIRTRERPQTSKAIRFIRAKSDMTACLHVGLSRPIFDAQS